MFKSEKKVSQFDTLISEKTEIRGSLNVSGGVHIDGLVIGNIMADSDSGAVVRISEKGHVEGEIRAPHIIVNGRVKGDIHSYSHIELAKKAEVTGDVYYNMMEMVMGARVTGKLIHSAQGDEMAVAALANPRASDDEQDADFAALGAKPAK